MRTRQGVVFARLCLNCGILHRWCTTGEAERLVLLGQATKHSIKGGRSYYYMLKFEPEPSLSRPTPTGISAEDMMAFVGIGDHITVSRVRERLGEFVQSSPRHNQWMPLPSIEEGAVINA